MRPIELKIQIINTFLLEASLSAHSYRVLPVYAREKPTIQRDDMGKITDCKFMRVHVELL